MKRLLIVGEAGHGRSVAEAVLVSGELVVARFFDDAFPELKRVWDVLMLSKVADLARWRGVADRAFVALDNNVLRQGVTAGLWVAGFSLVTVLHLRAVVSPSAVIGDGSAIMAGAIIGTEARLGDGAIVNCAAAVDHHCLVGDFGHLGVNAAMAGESVLGATASMQAGSVLGCGVTIGAWRVLEPGEAVRS